MTEKITEKEIIGKNFILLLCILMLINEQEEK